MFAQTHHGAMRHVAPVRTELPFRTIFNMLGPLSNPAGVTAQVFGVSRPAWAEPLTRVLATLGSRRVWTVHGSDGLDEITTTGPTAVVALEDGALTHFTIDPRAVGLPLATLDDLRGGDPEHNAAALAAVLEGARNAYRDIAVLNAGAGLVVAGAAGSLAEGWRGHRTRSIPARRGARSRASSPCRMRDRRLRTVLEHRAGYQIQDHALSSLCASSFSESRWPPFGTTL
ncbi:hypothetical protein GCM10025880_24980 [Methylorubrum aminovorans]|nr:hypothetical protein GCM10025880_24980 [Methylorubrum aminovorans]